MNVRTTIRSGADTHTGAEPKREIQLATVAAIGWLGVGLAGAWEIAEKNWPYLLYAAVVLLTAALTIATAWSCTRDTQRPSLRRAGLVAGVLAVASAIVAWALPLWMTTIAISCLLLSAAASRAVRSGLAALAAAQVVGLGATIVAIAADVGTQDASGDYPAAFGIGLVVTSVTSVLGLAVLVRACRTAVYGGCRQW